MTEPSEEGGPVHGPVHGSEKGASLEAQVRALAAENEALRRRVRALEASQASHPSAGLGGEQLETLRTSAFLNNRLIVAWLKDDEGRYAFMSSEYEHRFGVCAEEWLGKTDQEMWPAEISATYWTHDQKVLRTGEPLQAVEDAVYADGTRAHFLSLKFPYTDASGRRFVGGLAVDMTARLEAERALAESQERLRLAARMARFGTYYGDVEKGEINWSPEIQQIFGLPADAEQTVAIDAVPDFLHPDDRERVREKIAASFDPQGAGEFHDEHRVVHPNGEVHWILVQGRTLFRGTGANRRAVRVAGVAMDVTSRRRTEDELEKARRAAEAANEAKSVFLANMSHEIRTPMTAILGYADVLQTRLNDPDALSCVRTIRENGSYLCDLLNDILDLSKIELGRITVRSEPVSLIAILAEIRSLMTVRAAAKNLTLAAEIVGDIPETIQTDRKMVRQVLVNLVGNAIKFTEEGEIRITARAQRNQRAIEISVSDTGVGIAEHDIPTVFLPFEQLDNSSTRKAGGTGLGLAICRELVGMLGGELSVDSSPGEGTTFRFTFDAGPIEADAWIAPDPGILRTDAATDVPRPAPRIAGRILAADDRPEIRELLREYLESAGAELLTAEDGQQAVDAYLRAEAAAAPIDAVLMDVQMPTMDGLEATRRLRLEGFDGPVIAVTANAMRRDRARCLDAGCDDFISKPIERAQLVQTLADWLDRQRGLAGANVHGNLAILCVDDNDATRLSQQIVLEDRGHRVKTAATADQALEVVKQFTPDVAIIDLGLRGISGGQLLADLKANEALHQCYFVCLTGRSEEESDWQRLGFDAFVQKPIGVDKLEEIITRRSRR